MGKPEVSACTVKHTTLWMFMCALNDEIEKAREGMGGISGYTVSQMEAALRECTRAYKERN